MSEQVKINPDLLIILVGSVINKLISEYEGDLPDNRAYIPVDHFITLLNETTRKYTQDFPNDEINFPQIDIKLLSFIINRTLYFKFVSVTNDLVIVEVGDKYENYLKNIVATSTFRYSKFLLNGAKQLYKSEQESAKGNEEVSEVTEEVKDKDSTDKVIVPEKDTEEELQSVEKESNDIEEDKQREEEVKGKEVQETVAEEDAELVSPEIEDLSQVNENTSEIAQTEQKELEEKADPTNVNDEKEEENEQQEGEDAEVEAVEVEKVPEETKQEVPAASIEEANQEETEAVEQENTQNREGVEDQEQPEAQPEEPDHVSEVEEVEGTSSPDKETPEAASPSPVAAEAKEPPEEKSVEVMSPEPEPLATKSELPSRKRPRSHSPAPAQHQKRFQNIAVNLINSIQEHRFSSPFLQAVNPKDAPNYYEMIYEPKNLKGIQKALKSKSDPPAYLLIKELERDVMLMFANCIMYNRLDEDLVELTRTMKRDVEDMFKMFKEAELEMK